MTAKCTTMAAATTMQPPTMSPSSSSSVSSSNVIVGSGGVGGSGSSIGVESSSMSSLGGPTHHHHHHHHHHQSHPHHHHHLHHNPHQSRASSSSALSNQSTSASSSSGTASTTTTTTNGGSSSLSSLFERVTNFRRSLIKHQARSKTKSSTRPVSGTFSFFNGKTFESQQQHINNNNNNHHHHPNSPNVHPNSSSCSITETSATSCEIENAEDAIYGFTAGSTASLRLRMQRLNLSSASNTSGSQTSPTSTSSSSSIAPTSPSTASHPLSVDGQLYETIDETKKAQSAALLAGKYGAAGILSPMMMDPSRPLPALPPSLSKGESTQNLQNSPAKNSYLRAKQHHQQNKGSNRHQNRYYASSSNAAPTTASSSLSSSSSSSSSCSSSLLPQHSDLDWKRNRRSSAIILGTDFSSDLMTSSSSDPRCPMTSNAGMDLGSGSGHPHRHSFNPHLNRSSDDLLVASSRGFTTSLYPYTISPSDHKRIYENLRSSKVNSTGGGTGVEPFQHNNSCTALNATGSGSGGGGGIRGDHNRKLTKDSGYESASTLVNLGLQQQSQSTSAASSGEHQSALQAPPPPPPPSSASSSAQTQNLLKNHHHHSITNIRALHSRCDSIDSTSSLDLYHAVETRTFDRAPSEIGVRNFTAGHNSHSQPQHTHQLHHQNSTISNSISISASSSTGSSNNDSPPPTPPIRFSSLSQNRVNNGPQNQFTHSHIQSHPHQATGQQQQQHPQRQQHLKQDSIVSFVSSGSSHSSHCSSSAASTMSSSSSSAFLHSHAANNHHLHQQQQQQQQQPPHHHQHHPTHAQTHHLATPVIPTTTTTTTNNVNNGQQFSSQQASTSQHHGGQFLSSPPPLPPSSEFGQSHLPVNYRMVDVVLSSPSSPPPPLPPKNRQQQQQLPLTSRNVEMKQPPVVSEPVNSQAPVNDIKAIQKRAVYEFYLRQKEKKLKEKTESTPTTPLQSLSSPPLPVPNGLSHAAPLPSCDAELDNFDLPPPPPPEVAIPESLSLSESTHCSPSTVDDDDEEDFPPPPTPLAKSVDFLAAPPSPPGVQVCQDPLVQVTSLEPQLYRGIDLSSIWPMIDFRALLNPKLPLKESSLDDDDDDEADMNGTGEEADDHDEELVSIERARRTQVHNQCWRQSHLESIRLLAEQEATANERKHASLFQQLEQHGAKLESLGGDVTKISRLLVSIVGQLTQQQQQPAATTAATTTTTGDTEVTSDLADSLCTLTTADFTADSSGRAARLLGQLEDAKRLRDNIGTRRTMFESRIERCCERQRCQQTTTTTAPIGVAPNTDAKQLVTSMTEYLDTCERTLVLTELAKLITSQTVSQ